MSDKQKVIDYLKTHKYITCEDERSIGVRNLRSRISEIAGTVTEYINVIRRDGIKTRIARYSMVVEL